MLSRRAATQRITAAIAVLLVIGMWSAGQPFAWAAPAACADNPNPPSQPVRLVFIHHSTGGNWLANPNEDGPYGGLGAALMSNNYYVSATNYGWGPDDIGDRTDIVNWPEWFTGPDSATILNALYNESGQNIGDFGAWPRLATNPGGQNQIILFKSCFPNSDLYGHPGDAPLPQPNDYDYTVANAKAVYNKILTYFVTRQDKLFIVITAPPLSLDEYWSGDQPPAERAANARALANWLVNDWLDSYAHNNVAVFDYYNVLTSNGTPGRVDDPATNEEPNDAGRADGNHHRWQNNAVQHLQTVNNNYSAYPVGDSHPTTAGHQKATAEFVQVLNVFYNRWKGGVTPPTATSPAATPTRTRTPTRTATSPAATPTRTRTPLGTMTVRARIYLPIIVRG